LIDYGADIHARNKHGETPLKEALAGDDYDLSKLLMQLEAKE